LEIAGVSTSCGCTTAEIESRHLSPGEMTDLTVIYDPQVHDGETGSFLRVVYIRSNDPATPEATLTIRVMVVDPENSPDESTNSSVEAASLYRLFVCPCCGKDIGSCTCGMAEERRALIDQHIAYGTSQEQVYRVMFRAYGASAFFDQELAARVQTDLLAELPADRPVLVVEPMLVNLGKIPITGGLVNARFTVRNAGQSDLTITGLQTSCGCTTVVLKTTGGTSPIFGANSATNPTGWSAVLAPGEEALLIATFDPMAHGGSATGKFRRGISVISDDPLNSRLDVAFDVEVTQ
jgi:cytochrome c-type biogenesis protein CcmH/NrfF